MRLLSILFFSLIILASTICTAQELHLKDGTIIQGALLSFQNGVYTFSSKTLGIVKIQESQVLSINQESQYESPQTTNNQQALQQIQTGMMGDEVIMQLIQSLQNDPDVLAIMQDPQIMEALQRCDFKSLENNAKLQKIMGKSQVKAIKEKVAN